jgi:hypothetical protein
LTRAEDSAQGASFAAFFFFFSDAKFKPAATHALTQPRTTFFCSLALSCLVFFYDRPVLSCLVLYTPRAGRTLPAGEGGCAAGSLPPSHYLKLGPAVRCRSSPGFPFRFIWVLGWSTWYLCANDPTPCTCKTNYLRILMLFNIFLHFRRSFFVGLSPRPQRRPSSEAPGPLSVHLLAGAQ